MSGGDAEATRIYAFLRRLGSGCSRVRLGAKSELMDMDTEAIERAFVAVVREHAVRQRQCRRWWRYACVPVGAAFLAWIPHIVDFGLVCACLVLPPIAYLAALWRVRGIGRALPPLSRDTRAIGPLAETFNDALATPYDRSLITMARDMLVVLLPKATDADADMMSHSQRKALHRVLVKYADEALAIAILGALEHIGDAAAVEPVAKVACGRRAIRSGHRVQDAADRCLVRLGERWGQGINSISQGTGDASIAGKPYVDIRDIVRGLGSMDATLAVRSGVIVERLGPAIVDALLDLLREEARARHRRRAAGIVILATLLGLVVWLVVWKHGRLSDSPWVQMIVYAIGLFAATKAQRNASTVLTKFDDVRTVGALTEALEMGDSTVTSAVGSKLTELLPRLRASDAALLNDKQRRILDRVLMRHSRPAFVLAILGAWEQIGDAKSLEPVEKLAAGRGNAFFDRRVHEAAVDCHTALKQRAQAERDAQTLLRPVYSTDPEGTLLRPAHAPGTADPQVLLRPASNPDAVSVGSDDV
jgi:hypothetical protein